MSVVLIAPDSFKGSLTSVQVAQALAAGWSIARPDDEILLCPLADGGEGTLAAVEAAGGWIWRSDVVHDPLGRPVEARWLWRDIDGEGQAVIEMATASGLSRVKPEDRDPIAASSVGTGELLAEAIDQDVARITLGIGGSATTDGGRGLLEALLKDGNSARRLNDVDLEVACDVSNPLLGPTGAAAIFGPQKGATAAQVALLDARNAAWADQLEAREGRRERNTPGAGAAGGVGFALLTIQDHFASFALRPGVDLVMDATDFEPKLARANLVITGEGRIDAQTGFGKTALGVAKRAAAAGVPCIAVGGGVEPDGITALAAVGAVAVPVVERPQSVEEAMAAGTAPLERCGERLASLTNALTKSSD
ncbi:MAG TPA: glycerate kinase [Candidatus Limnocylindrales bacterium]|nr:glycerate kinase [Candidatus Limnocylindrales bacterium]